MSATHDKKKKKKLSFEVWVYIYKSKTKAQDLLKETEFYVILTASLIDWES